jgi:hypothetical protein
MMAKSARLGRKHRDGLLFRKIAARISAAPTGQIYAE